MRIHRILLWLGILSVLALAAACTSSAPPPNREPLDKIEGMFYFTSTVTYEGFDDQGAHLSPPSNFTVWLIPTEDKAAGYYSDKKYMLFVLGEPSVRGGAIYSVEGALVSQRLKSGGSPTIDDYKKLVQFTWPDSNPEDAGALANSAMRWVSRNQGERLFLVNSYKIAEPAAQKPAQ